MDLGSVLARNTSDVVLREQYTTLKDEHGRAARALAQSRRAAAELTEQVRTLSEALAAAELQARGDAQQVSAARAAQLDAQDEAAGLRAEHDTLAQQLALFQQKAQVATEQNRILRDELFHLREDHTRLRDEADHRDVVLRRHLGTIEQLRARCGLLESENARLLAGQEALEARAKAASDAWVHESLTAIDRQPPSELFLGPPAPPRPGRGGFFSISHLEEPSLEADSGFERGSARGVRGARDARLGGDDSLASSFGPSIAANVAGGAGSTAGAPARSGLSQNTLRYLQRLRDEYTGDASTGASSVFASSERPLGRASALYGAGRGLQAPNTRTI